MKGLERSVAPRIGGLRNQYLVVLTEKITHYQMELLESNGRKYLLLADHSKESQVCAPFSPSISNLASTIPYQLELPFEERHPNSAPLSCLLVGPVYTPFVAFRRFQYLLPSSQLCTSLSQVEKPNSKNRPPQRSSCVTP